MHHFSYNRSRNSGKHIAYPTIVGFIGQFYFLTEMQHHIVQIQINQLFHRFEFSFTREITLSQPTDLFLDPFFLSLCAKDFIFIKIHPSHHAFQIGSQQFNLLKHHLPVFRLQYFQFRTKAIYRFYIGLTICFQFLNQCLHLETTLFILL